MSVLSELLHYIVPLLKQNTTGVLNFTNPGSISHNEILEMYKEIVDPTFKWSNFDLESLFVSDVQCLLPLLVARKII